MSFHQVNRRVHLLRSRGLLGETSHGGRGRRYGLTPTGRRGMALIAALGRWRERVGLAAKPRGLTVGEMKTVLRVALPLLKLPQHPEAQIKLGIAGATDEGAGRGSAIVLVSCSRDGTLRVSGEAGQPRRCVCLRLRQHLAAALVEGNRGRMRVGGELALVDACLAGLHGALRSPPKPS